jgi:transposase
MIEINNENAPTVAHIVQEGHNRQEQNAFTTFRSYYLFDSRYCTPSQGHEKGGVKSDVGYFQRNVFAPIPKVANLATLNASLHQACLNYMQRRVRGETQLVAEVWLAEKFALLPISLVDYLA